MQNKIDFAGIAARALGSIDSLVRQWLPEGKREGEEYKALNPTRSDSKIGSFTINLRSGAWGDFATGDYGGDLISLYAYIFGLDQGAAAKELADVLGMPAADIPAAAQAAPKKKARSPWRPIHPAPDDVPIPAAHPVRGRPQSMWFYRDAAGAINGVVCRFETSDGGKETLPLCYAENTETGARDWRWMAFAEPRPLYGLDRLAAHPDLPVLLVEGEKCADVARDLLPELVICTWPGGSKAVEKADWKPLFGRNIFAWADCDAQREPLTREQKAAGVDPESMPFMPEDKQPGMRAMRQIQTILGTAARFRIVDIPAPGQRPPGWDIADAVNEGMSAEALKAFIRNVRPPAQAEPEAPPPGYGWDTSILLYKNHELVPSLANLFHILRNDPNWAGVLAYNKFAYQVMKLKPPPFEGGEVGEWNEEDDANTAIWLSNRYRFSPTAALTGDAVEVVSKHSAFHPVQDYLTALVWDGTERLDNWITEYIGAPKNDYIWRVSRWFLMGMVARAMQPGIKFDYCLVLEGEQGRMKSAAFRALGGEWYGDTDLDLHNKDAMSAIRGKWLWEFAELGSLARSEATRQKSFLSRQVDEFRPVYGRREIRSPRQLCFGGTTNDHEWNKDPTGARRFWPVTCPREVDYKGIAAARDQLFAEAMIYYRAGERFWPTAEEQREIFDDVQARRNAPETLVDMLHDWVFERYDHFSLADAAIDCLKLDAAKLTRDLQTRIGNALHQLGCSKIRRWTRAKPTAKRVSQYWYVPPRRVDEPEPPPDAEANADKKEEEPPAIDY